MNVNTAAARLFQTLAKVARVPEREGFRLARMSLIVDIVRLIGIDAVANLTRDFGGRRVYIPSTPSRRDQIARSIGLAAAVRLASRYGGDRVMFPAHPDRALRAAQIIALRMNGVSVSRIARRTGCTERYVYKVLASRRIDE